MLSAEGSIATVGLLTLAMMAVTWTGVFDSVFTENGPDHYAEKRWGPVPDLVPMPLNTIINLGYILVGLFWFCRVRNMERNQTLLPQEAELFFPFLSMSVLYGLIQLARILTQQHYWAVMDQWYTLPFFAWAVIWGLNLQKHSSIMLASAILVASLGSYSLSLVISWGFELGLGIHALSALATAIQMYLQSPTRETTYAFWMTALSFSMFVCLKLLDHTLPLLHPVFHYVSGHFLSKVGDIMQIHYSATFFYSCRTQHAKEQ